MPGGVCQDNSSEHADSEGNGEREEKINRGHSSWSERAWLISNQRASGTNQPSTAGVNAWLLRRRIKFRSALITLYEAHPEEPIIKAAIGRLSIILQDLTGDLFTAGEGPDFGVGAPFGGDATQPPDKADDGGNGCREFHFICRRTGWLLRRRGSRPGGSRCLSAGMRRRR